jgi:hypothetical protein
MHVFSTSALVGGEWSASSPGCFTAGEIAPVGGWMGPKLLVFVLAVRSALLPFINTCPHCSGASVF